MATRRPKEPEHRHSGEFVREVVVAVVPEQDRDRYMPFARELYATLHHSREQGTVEGGHVPGATRGTRRGCVPSACVGLSAVQSPFSTRTKRCVQKWFERGLSGKLLWQIGERLLGRLYPAAGPGRSWN
jgi:hypothetical protein